MNSSKLVSLLKIYVEVLEKNLFEFLPATRGTALFAYNST